MTKRNEKLVCVGWGIVMYPLARPYLYYGISGWDTRRETISRYEQDGHAYQYDRRRHKAIAKKLWMEVKDE